ncbi:uncharacterized protein DUF1376 [Methylosinus sp. sav-2]|uniref:DUF1376 domain-containing protein n=1 Tax=Methylosinus sp. sav-2 TaxID=2485168 RepID=UPI00068957B7|nr:DUF1376 domain-containing protein [Methylosinus sp. sav-2]TDX61947.1 uncharacterized protein DUF1376 [Methylosinus sp. sav-2]
MVNVPPAPLVPPDVDLRDFAFMPLDVVRLRDSDISAKATAEEFRCAVLLWCASWHQVPAGSLPDDDAILSNLAGFGRAVGEWKKHRDGALWKWIKCSDGRLYHPVVAEKAVESWQAKKRQRDRTEAARAARLSQRPSSPVTIDVTEQVPRAARSSQPPNEPVTNSVTERKARNERLSQTHADDVTEIVTSSKGQGQYKGQGEIDNLPAQRPVPRAPAESDRPESERPPDPGAAPAKSELDRVEDACRAALGSAQPQDLVIGPMVEIVRKFGQERVSLCLASEARRPREKPIRTWKIWARIVVESIGSSASPAGPAERLISLGFGGVEMPEANLAAAIERWRRAPASWMRNVWGPPPDENRTIRKFAAERGIELTKIGDAA